MKKNDSVIGKTWESIYGTRQVVKVQDFRGKQVALIQTGDSRVGHQIIPLNDLDSEIAFEKKQAAQRADSKQQMRQKEQAEKAAREEYLNMSGFGSEMSPMRRARAASSLAKQVIYNNRAMTIKSVVEEMIANGAVVVHLRDRQLKGGHRRLVKPNGNFLAQRDITKTGMDYAEFLSEAS